MNATNTRTNAICTDASPLLRAAWNGQLEVVRWLIEAGARCDISKKDDMGITPLGYAAIHGRLSCARLLYSAGAREDVRALDALHNTPLTLTMTHGSSMSGRSLDKNTMDVVKWLLLAGAEVRLCDVEREERADHSVWDEVIAWAQSQLVQRKTFAETVLYGMIRKSGSSHLSQLEGAEGARQLIAEFCGVSCGEELRNLRQIEPHLRTLMVEASFSDLDMTDESETGSQVSDQDTNDDVLD